MILKHYLKKTQRISNQIDKKKKSSVISSQLQYRKK